MTHYRFREVHQLFHYLYLLEAKKAEINEFYNHAFEIKYFQDDENTCCFISLALNLIVDIEYVA